MSTLRATTLSTLSGLTSVNIEDLLTLQSSINAMKYTAAGGMSRTVLDKFSESLSVLDYVTGDGVTDDTVAFQAAVDEAQSLGVALDFPGCKIRLTAPITVHSGTTIIGHGRGVSVINHDHTGSMFANSSFLQGLKFIDFAVAKTSASMLSGKYLFDFTAGVQSFLAEGLIVGNVDTAGIKLYGVFNTGESTTINGNIVFRECLVNQFSGRGFNFGMGDSIWFYGGRIIGTHDQTTDWKTNGAQGIYLNGGMGGFWLYGTDIVLCKYGMIIEDSNGYSNKEIFLNSPCFDSCSAMGLAIWDKTSYVSVSNIWAASCEVANVHTETEFAGQLIICGGTIYNAGARGLNTSTTAPPCGCVFNAGGKIHLSDVHIRNNGNGVSTGKGIWCPSSTGVTSLKLIGIQSYNNQSADSLGASTNLMVEDSFFDVSPSMISLSSNPGIHHVRNNVGYPASIATPAVPATSVAMTYASSASPAMVYLNGGTVTGVAINGTTVFTSSNVSFMLSPGDSVTLVYSAAPTWAFVSIH